MSRNGTYKIVEEKKLIVQFFSGDIEKDDIILVQKAMSNESNYCANFDIVVDFRSANLLLDEQDLLDYVGFLKNYAKVQGKRKSGYLTSKPKEVVLTTLFSLQIEDTLIKPDVFSTPKALANWLNIAGVDDQLLSSVISELKSQLSNLG